MGKGAQSRAAADVYKNLLLNPGGKKIPEGFRTTTGFGFRGAQVIPAKQAANVLDAFKYTFGERLYNKQIGRVRNEAKKTLRDKITANLFQRRGTFGQVSTTSGARRRRGGFTSSPVLGQTTTLG